MRKTLAAFMLLWLACCRPAPADIAYLRGMTDEASDVVVADVIADTTLRVQKVAWTVAGYDRTQLRVVQSLKGFTKPGQVLSVQYALGWADDGLKTMEQPRLEIGKRYVIFVQAAALFTPTSQTTRRWSYTLVDDYFGAQVYRLSLVQAVSEQVESDKHRPVRLRISP